MRKMISLFLILLLMTSIVSCGGGSGGRPADVSSKDSVDIDLTTMSSTLIYAEVYNMMQSPESYCGKTIKVKGQFDVFEDQNTGARYFLCMIADALSCCSQGMEFLTADPIDYPQDYPKIGQEITVVGTFELYEEYGELYCRLADAMIS